MSIFKRSETDERTAAASTREEIPDARAADAMEDPVAMLDAQPLPVSPPAPLPPPTGARASARGTILAPGTVLEGTLRAGEPVQVSGMLQGTLEADAAVVVEAGGRLVARVTAPEMVVSGLVDGRVDCQGRLEVRASGLVMGKLHVGTLRIEVGAVLDGQLQMGAGDSATLVDASPPAPSAEGPRPRKAGSRGSDSPSNVPPVLQRLAAGE